MHWKIVNIELTELQGLPMILLKFYRWGKWDAERLEKKKIPWSETKKDTGRTTAES